MVDAVAADADEILLEEPRTVAVCEGEARPFCFAGVVVVEVAIFSDDATWHRVMERACCCCCRRSAHTYA